ncbi:MAG: hypothetical protein WBZ00_03140 [Solirubrobacterales bacterium]
MPQSASLPGGGVDGDLLKDLTIPLFTAAIDSHSVASHSMSGA